MAPVTRIRHKDIRIVAPQTPGIDKDEEKFAEGRYFEADCLASDAVTDFVYITGDTVGGFYQVTKVDPYVPATMPAVGYIAEKSTATRCFVQTLGVIEVAGGLTPGGRYWIGADSRLDAAFPPRLSGQIVVAQVVGVALSSTDLLLRPEFQAHKLRG